MVLHGQLFCFYQVRSDLITTYFLDTADQYHTETFAPVLLKKQAKKLRKETGCNRYFALQELKSDAAFTLAQTITRPLTMLVFEPIILFTAIYVSLAWSMVFFYFQAYPIIFEGLSPRYQT